jgi:hypothetical protein
MVAEARKVGDNRYRESYGRCFEDFTVGDVYEHRPGRTITEADNTWFTLLTMNQHPLHFDREYARHTEFGQPIVNSALTLAVVTGMSVSDVSQKAIANRGVGEARIQVAPDARHRHHRDARAQGRRHPGHGVQAHHADPQARAQHRGPDRSRAPGRGLRATWARHARSSG